MGAVRKLAADPESKDKNRIGVLLGTKQTRETKTLTHVMWALFNLLPARTTQKPHRHTPTALDFAVSAPAKGESLPLLSVCPKSPAFGKVSPVHSMPAVVEFCLLAMPIPMIYTQRRSYRDRHKPCFCFVPLRIH